MLSPGDLHAYDLLAKAIHVALWAPLFIIGVIACVEDWFTATRRR